MGILTRRSPRPTRRQLLTLEPLEDRTLLAGNLLITSEVPGAIQYHLMQYTPQGSQVSSQNIPQSPTATEYQDARGLTVDSSGNVHIFDGTSSPFLDTYSPGQPSPWSYQTASGWATDSNITSGEVVADNNYVFASNEQSTNGVSYGMVRFDLSGGSPVLLAPGYSFTQITLGLDGQLYGVEEPFSDHTVVQVFNLDTLAPVKTLTLKPVDTSDYLRSIAVDASGNIYGAYWGGYVVKYDANGNPTGASIQCMSPYGGGENLMNIALDTDGQIAVGGRGGEIYLTNESLTSVQTIQTGQWDVFATFDHYIGVGTNASFVKTDTTTEGSWQKVYGNQGYNVIDNATSYPSYAQVSPSGNANYVWSSSTSDPRALQDASDSSRIAACWYSSSSFTVNVNLTDGQTHQLALYLLDWENAGRSEEVDILNAATGAVLSTQTVSNFQNGEYLVWNVSGDVTVRITNTGGRNAVLSGLFFDPAATPSPPPSPGTASFLKTDTTTEGSWQKVYGNQGYNVIDNASSYPSYAQVSPSGNSNYVWSSSTSDPRALQDASDSSRIAASWYSSSSFTVNVDLTDGQTHQLALYLLDWDSAGRSEEVDILDAATGAVLSTQTASNFQNGEYLVWNVSGDVTIRITDKGGPNAVLSGLFVDPAGTVPPPPPPPSPGTASFLKTDTTTEGSWKSVYGSQGYNVIDNATSYPSYAQVSSSGNSNYVWSNSTSDPRALQDASDSSRIAASWYSSSSFTVNVNLTDGQTHQLALYLLDWDNQGRSEEVDILNASTGAVLNTQTASNFQKGEYLVWNVSGDVTVRITEKGGPNAVLSGLFLDA